MGSRGKAEKVTNQQSSPSVSTPAGLKSNYDPQPIQ